MGKIIRLTETDLKRLITKILKESNEEKASSITIRLTKKWQNRLSDMEDADLHGHLPLGREQVKLYPNQWFQIGLGPYELRRNNRTLFYASYIPENNEIYVHAVNCKGRSIDRMQNEKQAHPSFFENIFDKGIYKNDGVESGCVSAGGFYSKFEDSMGGHRLKVGELDHRGYFEIVDIGETKNVE